GSAAEHGALAAVSSACGTARVAGTECRAAAEHDGASDGSQGRRESMNSATSHPVEREELMAFLDGQPCGDAKAVAAHLESCGECQAVVEQLRLTTAKLAAWSVETPSLRINRQVLSAASNRSPISRPTELWGLSWKRWTVAVASLAVAVLAPW